MSDPLREAAQAVSDRAVANTNTATGQPVWIVRDEQFSALRAALSAVSVPRDDNAEIARLAALMRQIGCTVNVDQIAYYLVKEGVRCSAVSVPTRVPTRVDEESLRAEWRALVQEAAVIGASQGVLPSSLRHRAEDLFARLAAPQPVPEEPT